MPGLPEEVSSDPVLLSQLDRIDTQGKQLAAAESASDQHGEDRVIPLAAERIAVHTCQKPLALLGRKPIPDTDSNPAHSFDASNLGRKLRIEQAGIGGLLCDPSDGGEAQVDRRRCVQFLFEENSVSQDDGAI